MNPADASDLLKQFKAGDISESQVLDSLQQLTSCISDYAQIDLDRARRKGFPEVVFAEGKTTPQTVNIVAEIYRRHGRFLATRVNDSQAEAIQEEFPTAVHHKAARCMTLEDSPLERNGMVAVLTAGTSDLPVAEEVMVTVESMGFSIKRIVDVGIAGIHRLLAARNLFEKADVIVVVAGMEGALPSAVAGLTGIPVIAVPTSVGYGASFGGLAALLGMLNSCGSGVTVVNIDNGFGAGYAAGQICAMLDQARK
ncbi:MAG TPA: nickel pincer cofactor biosynthesis protein LarB [Verrucomicrobiales bacterium]|nr:nickel pincer cofactor biosynthesis protein LarB [Verrucomicrobiales bacterium]HIL70788.1 nickel pincer cofactor biosynthesis protein LarB [Verrucomicrobiota bacterium]